MAGSLGVHLDLLRFLLFPLLLLLLFLLLGFDGEVLHHFDDIPLGGLIGDVSELVEGCGDECFHLWEGALPEVFDALGSELEFKFVLGGLLLLLALHLLPDQLCEVALFVAVLLDELVVHCLFRLVDGVALDAVIGVDFVNEAVLESQKPLVVPLLLGDQLIHQLLHVLVLPPTRKVNAVELLVADQVELPLEQLHLVHARPLPHSAVETEPLLDPVHEQHVVLADLAAGLCGQRLEVGIGVLEVGLLAQRVDLELLVALQQVEHNRPQLGVRLVHLVLRLVVAGLEVGVLELQLHELGRRLLLVDVLVDLPHDRVQLDVVLASFHYYYKLETMCKLQHSICQAVAYQSKLMGGIWRLQIIINQRAL
jgi:hypothetical protein